MINNKVTYPAAGEINVKGYAGKINDYVTNAQFYDADLWRLTVNQFRTLPDGGTNGWRGEFWGKLMRSASLTYRVTKDKKLYAEITASVKDMLSAQENCGRFSTYSKETEFHGWDVWGRKYVMLGFIYYIEICKTEALRNRIIRALKRHADYILKKVGTDKHQTDICMTSGVYGGMNSCSILEPFVKLYNLTGEQKYIDFAEYIVSTGFSKDFDLYNACLEKKNYPYEFKYTKAYEMMSCFEGLLEYYKVKGDENYLKAVQNFFDMVVVSDYTLIGCSGCTHELFDHSSVKQTEYSDGVMQETCVTVTFMKLAAKLFALTGEVRYIDVIERSGYNALFGAVNNEKQTMKRTLGVVWKGDKAIPTPHEPYPFDSYSPLYLGQRAKKVGGFMVMENGKTYGCCASIGGAATAVFSLAGICKTDDGYSVNLFNEEIFKNKTNGYKTEIAVKANVYATPHAKIAVKSDNEKFRLYIRIPHWMENPKIRIDGEETELSVKNGYFSLEKVWSKSVIDISYKTPVRAVKLNGKVAYSRGPVVLCRDERFGEDLTLPVKVKIKKGAVPSAKVVTNDKFDSNLTVRMKTIEGKFVTFCDYSQAGKNYDSEHCTISVWNKLS